MEKSSRIRRRLAPIPSSVRSRIIMPENQTYTFYFGGELFSHKHLLGNAYLAREIHEVSHGKFVAILPQDLELRDHHPQSIRDQDILGLLRCDLGLFNYDGPELDSGTVVEFMIAKFADIPAVILRTDFRAGGDQEADPWNLMSSFYPRTEVVITPSMPLVKNSTFQNVLHDHSNVTDTGFNVAAQEAAVKKIAVKTIEAMENVLRQAPVLEAADVDAIYRYLAKMPGFRTHPEKVVRIIESALNRKKAKGLL